MKIGDEVYIHGYVDEIRKDTVIIRNEGGYFGTIESELISDKQWGGGRVLIGTPQNLTLSFEGITPKARRELCNVIEKLINCIATSATETQTDKMTEEEIDTMLAKVLVGQTDCGWK